MTGTTGTSGALVLVDVDGVLNPDDHTLPGFTVHQLSPTGHGVFPVALNPAHGTALLELAEATGAELAWATTWERHANTLIGPLLGLPELPVVPLRRKFSGAVFKAESVAEYAAGRPFVWMDDDPFQAMRDTPGTLFTGPHLVIEVAPRFGLQDHHVAQARNWLRTLTGR